MGPGSEFQMAGELSGATTTPRAGSVGHGFRWRIALGTALITAAAALVLVAHRAAQQPPSTRWLVVDTEVDAGAPLLDSDLSAALIDLPAGVDGVPVSELEDLRGRVAAHRLAPGQLLTQHDLLESDRFWDSAGIEVAVTVDEERAPLGGLKPGERVEVLSTDPEGEGTRTLLGGVRVIAVDNGAQEGIGASGGVQVLLAVTDDEAATALVDAAVREQLTLVVAGPAPADRASATPLPPSPPTGQGSNAERDTEGGSR